MWSALAADDYGPLQGYPLVRRRTTWRTRPSRFPLVGFGVISGQQVGVAESVHDFGEVRIENPYGEASRSALWPLQIIHQDAQGRSR